MQRISFGASLAALGVVILTTATPAAAGMDPLFGGDASLRSTPASSCAGAKALQDPQATPERRMAWWPELCGACSTSTSCVGLLVWDVRSCALEDGGGRGTCQNTGNYCTDSDPDDNRDEVSCYCEYLGSAS
jgi:hypothetical protein